MTHNQIVGDKVTQKIRQIVDELKPGNIAQGKPLERLLNEFSIALIERVQFLQAQKGTEEIKEAE